MFAILYRWTVKSGREDQFRRAWNQITSELQDQHGGTAARLHRDHNDNWVAYAQWPSRDAWESAARQPAPPSSARDEMLACVETSEILYFLDVVEDLFPKS